MKARRWPILVGLMALLTMGGLAIGVGWLLPESWHMRTETIPQLEPSPVTGLRQFPLVLDPQSDLQDAIPQQDLERALELLEPYWEYRRASELLHALRLWGPEADFPPRAVYPLPDGVRPVSSPEMLDFFLDESQYRRLYPDAKPYFFHSRYGLGSREGDEISATSHRDDFLELAAEVRLPTDTLVRWGETPSDLRSVFAHSFKWYHPGQELEFTAVAYAHYLQPGATWVDRFGVTHDFNELVEQLLAHDLNRCACHGTHVPYALAVLLAAHQKEPLLSHEACDRVEAALRSFSRSLYASQSGAGYWNRHWCRALETSEAIDVEDVEWVRCTRHHLEWMALVRPELRPPEANVRRAIRFLLDVLCTRSTSSLTRGIDFNVCSHAARALVLLAGKHYASQVMEDNWKNRSQ